MGSEFTTEVRISSEVCWSWNRVVIKLVSDDLMSGTGIDISADYWIIEHFHIRNYFYGVLVAVSGSHNIFRNMVFDATHEMIGGEFQGIAINGDYNLIENCTAHHIGGIEPGGVDGRDCDGGGFRITGDYNIIRNSKAYNNWHFQLSIDNTPENNAIGNVVDGGEYYNGIYDTAIAWADASSTVVKNVVTHDCESGLRAYAQIEIRVNSKLYNAFTADSSGWFTFDYNNGFTKDSMIFEAKIAGGIPE